MDPAGKIGPILKLLDDYYGDAHVTLDFTNPLELLVATVLSAQCTDVRVNQVTPAIFSQYPTAPSTPMPPSRTWSRPSTPPVFTIRRPRASRLSARPWFKNSAARCRLPWMTW